MDVVVPVPLHRDREKERRYNQPELLSRPLAKLLRLPHRGVLLVRKRPRPAKHLLTLRERWQRRVAHLRHVQAAKLTISASYC
jgi:predicted amidophosphoribosyltransferase